MERISRLGSIGIASLTLVGHLGGCGDPGAVGNGEANSSAIVLASGELLLRRGNCLECHAAGEAETSRVGTMAAPSVTGKGSVALRRSPEFLERYLLDPAAEKPTTRMPNLLHGLPEAERIEAAKDLVHFLLNAPNTPEDPRRSGALVEATAVLPGIPEEGARLFATIGCANCHGETPDFRYHATSTTVPALAGVLLDPSTVWLSGHMPSMALSEDEAAAIAAWILHPQALGPDALASGTFAASTAEGLAALEEAPIHRAPGLLAELIDGPVPPQGVELDGGADRRYVAEAPEIPDDCPPELFALRFKGAVAIPAAGRWTFHLTSDDGSRLYLDGALAIANDGDHGMVTRSVSRELPAGPIPMALTFFQSHGELGLKLEWEGPDTPRQLVPASAFSHETLLYSPPANGAFETDPVRVERGGALFLELGCMNCHLPRMAKMLADRGGPKAKPLADLDPTRGCLAETVPAASPFYAFTEAQRDEARFAVAAGEQLASPLEPTEELARTLGRLHCLDCHVRDGLGGPDQAKRALLTSKEEADMGDQGRYPPTLTGVGDKLRPEALEKTLDGSIRVRPYLAARMPVYGAGVTDRLPELFATIDAVPAHAAEPTFSEEAVEQGRLIAGTEGLGCITCHTLAGHASLGIPAVDLAAMHSRLRPGWFRELMLDPASLQPGTRMSQFWIPGERIMPQIGNGDPIRQIDAVWNYLSLGSSMPLPAGLVVEAGAYHLEPGERPILFGTFMKGVSPRTICVGYPQRLHVAYDAQASRLAKAWRGDFMDAEGTWHARAGMLQEPLGEDTIDFIAGDPVAVLASDAAAWPEASPRGGWKSAGLARDAAGVPTFFSELRDEDGATELRLLDRATPRPRPGGVRLLRQLSVESPESRRDLFHRVAAGRSIVAVESGAAPAFRIDDGPTVSFTGGGEPIVRSIDGGFELLVPLRFGYVEGAAWPYRADLAAEWNW